MPVAVSREAKRDLKTIFQSGADRFGRQQALAYASELTALFDLLERFPRMAAAVRGLTPEIRLHTHKAHVIAYRVDPDERVIVLRVLYARSDWQSVLRNP